MTPYMPEVDAIAAQQEATFRMARQIAVKGKVLRPGEGPQRCVALVTPGRIIIPIPCPPADSCAADAIAALRRIVSEEQPQTISVIAFNDVSTFKSADLERPRGITAQMIHTMIPFLGHLLGLTCLGHSVVVFEGHASALALGCRDADLLIVMEAMAVHLSRDWVRVAAGALRKPRILLFGKDGCVTPKSATSGESPAAFDLTAAPADFTSLARLVHLLGNDPLVLTMPNPESYLPKASASPAPQLGKKICPHCGKEISAYAVKCRFCKAEL